MFKFVDCPRLDNYFNCNQLYFSAEQFLSLSPIYYQLHRFGVVQLNERGRVSHVN